MNKKQSGITLIELMIAIALGLFLISGLIYLYVGSKQSYSTQAAVARVQETLRFAFEFFAYDVRMAGFTGCVNPRDSTPFVVANAPLPELGLTGSVRGYDNGVGWTQPTGWPNRVAGTDVLTISSVSNDCGANLVAPFSNGSQLFISANSCGFVDNQVLVVTDCRRADVFRGAFSNSGGSVNVAHGSAQNTQPTGTPCPPGSGKLVSECTTAGNYKGDAFLASLVGWTFYIGLNDRGNPALYRGGYNAGAPEELVEGVYDMQLEFGLDTIDDTIFVADQYLPANSINVPSTAPHWGQVISVRATFSARSNEDGVMPQAATYPYNGNAATSDRRYRQTYTTVIGLRNYVQ
jgi:type IV pilus assembly protein PilW